DRLEEISLNRRLNYVQNLKQELRQRFKKEYLGQLVQRSNKRLKDNNLQVGDVVLIESNNLKRVDWPLAVVVEVMPDREGVVRVAKVKTSQGTLVRPIQRLYHLEISKKDIEIIKKRIVP
ncbi:hypothetical protein, partial [Klebsiella pneumoniae]|uniref:hypothetical protein n=1 Tax=Klebsiella pneumoniae TaxID=573 RepID=UPI00163D9402